MRTFLTRQRAALLVALPLRSGAVLAVGAPSLADMKVAKYDSEWARANMDRVRKKWGEVSGH